MLNGGSLNTDLTEYIIPIWMYCVATHYFKSPVIQTFILCQLSHILSENTYCSNRRKISHWITFLYRPHPHHFLLMYSNKLGWCFFFLIVIDLLVHVEIEKIPGVNFRLNDTFMCTVLAICRFWESVLSYTTTSY